jgi:putative cardiolipin synthase
MHNKSMTVDGVTTVIGGRNIGDIHFLHGQASPIPKCGHS